MTSLCRKYYHDSEIKNQIRVIRTVPETDTQDEWDIEHISLIPSLSATLIFLSVAIGIPGLFYLFEYLFWSLL